VLSDYSMLGRALSEHVQESLDRVTSLRRASSERRPVSGRITVDAETNTTSVSGV
jgi:hypothetical protein